MGLEIRKTPIPQANWMRPKRAAHLKPIDPIFRSCVSCTYCSSIQPINLTLSLGPLDPSNQFIN